MAHTDNRQLGVQGVLSVHSSRMETATSGVDTTARIWRVGRCAAPHAARVPEKVWSANSHHGALLAAGEGDIRFWNPETGQELPSWIRQPDGILFARFLPEGDGLITAGILPAVHAWPLTPPFDGPCLEGHREDVNTVRFSPDGRYLATAGGHWMRGGDGRVLIWDRGPGHDEIPADPLRVLEGGRDWTRGRTPMDTPHRGRHARTYLVWEAPARLRDQPVRDLPTAFGMSPCAGWERVGRGLGHGSGVPLPVFEWNCETERVGTYAGQQDVVDALPTTGLGSSNDRNFTFVMSVLCISAPREVPETTRCNSTTGAIISSRSPIRTDCSQSRVVSAPSRNRKSGERSGA